MEDLSSSNRVVVGIDGSANAVAALSWALEEAQPRGALVEAVYVWHESSISYGAPGYVPLSQDDVDDLARKILDAALSTLSLSTDEIKVDLRAATGVPVEVLRAAIEATEVAMVVLGARGHGGVSGLLLGSVSQSMTHRSSKPVAIIPTGWTADSSGAAARTIVVGVDGSEESGRALVWAVAEAAARGWAVEAVMVWSPPSPVLPAHLPLGAMKGVGDDSKVLDVLREFVGKVDASGVPVECTIVEGHPAEALLERASAGQLLVVGSRGRGRAREALWGSVSHAVTHRAAVPVVVVPTHHGG